MVCECNALLLSPAAAHNIRILVGLANGNLIRPNFDSAFEKNTDQLAALYLCNQQFISHSKMANKEYGTACVFHVFRGPKRDGIAIFDGAKKTWHSLLRWGQQFL